MIIVEGIDNSGKTTLVDYLARHLHMPVQASEGPPKHEGELEERLERYSDLPPTIFDRHPIISQAIYGSMRGDSGINPRWVSWLYDEQKPFIIYCDPLDRWLNGHRRNAIDTDEHLKRVAHHYETLRLHYRNWAIKHAHFIYRIGDSMHRVVCACAPRVDMYDDIRTFHEKYELAYDDEPRALPDEMETFRIRFMLEELIEYAGLEPNAETRVKKQFAYALETGALKDVSLPHQLDALVDLVYVALGTAYLQGFDFNEAWRRVHAANMTKVRVKIAEDSKRGSIYDVSKPPDWIPPDLSDLAR